MIPKREMCLFEGTRDTSDMSHCICGTSSCLVILRYNCATLIWIIFIMQMMMFNVSCSSALCMCGIKEKNL